ncbi:hypothetical protein [Tropicibacter sp. S64]|uniref:hypothetical protein n=1 Tax=Tropicibacter sp. S64 TaxID=3415122 RepID=UPI003C79D3A2
MFAEAVHQTVGVGVGMFLGTMIGFGLRAKKGKTDGLVQGSVWKTALVAGFVSWLAAAVLSMVF